MGKRKGEISPRRLADVLEVTRKTVYRWCREAVSGGTSTRIRPDAVRRDVTGHYWINRDEADRIQAEK